MDLTTLLPTLLGLAWLLPLASFVADRLLGAADGPRRQAAPATWPRLAIVGSIAAFACGLGLLAHGVHPLAAARAEPPRSRPSAATGTRWAEFGSLQLTIGYYIDALTVAMFCMVTLVASCIHVYSFGYMHEELHEVTDPLVRWPTASRCAAAAGSTASSSTCRSSASACWAW